MNQIQQLELLSESIKNEIDELQSLLENSEDYVKKAKLSKFETLLFNIISNLENTNDSIYGVYEDLNANDHSEELKNTNMIMQEVLQDKLSYDEKLDMRLKHNIDIY